MVISTFIRMTILLHTISLCELTDGIELDALITQVLRVDNDIVLGFAISDQHTDLSRVGSHPNILFEIVLEEVVQSQTCNEDVIVTFFILIDTQYKMCFCAYRTRSGIKALNKEIKVPVRVFPPL